MPFLVNFAPVQGYFSTLDTVCVYDNFKKPSQDRFDLTIYYP